MFELDRETACELNRNVSAPHRHAYHEIIWVREGVAAHLLDGDTLEFPMQTLLVVPKGRIHRFHPSADCLGSVIRFREEFRPESSPLLFSEMVSYRALSLNPEQVGVVESYLTLLSIWHVQSDPFSLQALRHLLAAFLARLQEMLLLLSNVAPRDFSATLSLWKRLNDQLEQNFRREHAVGYYTSRLGVSPRKLGAVARLYTGRHVSEIIDERLVTEAKRLLLYSGLTIKEIAFELGFEEHSYFTKVFRRMTGRTPSEFRPNGASA